MNENVMELFSEEQIENISYLLEKNNNILLNNKEYVKQQRKANKLHEQISNNSSEKVKDMFCEYDSLILASIRYELSLIYHLGIKKGLEMKDLITT